MSKTTVIETVSDDPKLYARRAELEQERQSAAAARNRLRPEGSGGGLPFDLGFLEAENRVKKLDESLAEVNRQIAAVERGAHERVVAGRRPGRLDLLRQLLAAAEVAWAAARAVEQYDAETAARVGLAPGPAVAAKLVELGGAIEEIRREIDGPRELPPPVLPHGSVRVRVVVPFYDKEKIRRYPGVEIVDETDAQKALEEKWAVPVERGA